MKFEDKIIEVQNSLIQEDIDAWLIFDFRHSNSLAYTFLEIPSEKKTTRRFFYWIPKKGHPIKLVSFVEPYILNHLPGEKWIYKGWQDLERLLFSLIVDVKKVAMEYSPYQALPTVSKVDAGMIDLIRRQGAEVVSSANLLQIYTSRWTTEQFQTHLIAAKVLENIVDQTWAFIEHSLQTQHPINEYHVQQFMLKAMHQNQCETSSNPTCAINAHSADPHYSPEEKTSHIIQKGDFILLDLWCKQKASKAVYADITRVGVAGKPSQKQKEIFYLVKEARDHATLFIKNHYENQIPLQGWQVDQACRQVIEEAGYGDYFIHRTGHNIGEEVHGPGANLDDLETHDNRSLIEGTCFSIEPGIYLSGEFGMRLEYDIYLDPAGKMMITGGIQEEIVCLNI